MLNLMSYISKNPCKLWRLSSVASIFYGGYSFTSGTLEAGVMLNILHLIVAIPSLVLIPKVVVLQGQIETIKRTNSANSPEPCCNRKLEI